MLQNVRRAIVSFAWVVLAYCVYLLCIVPFVERSRPAAATESVQAVASHEATSTDRFVRELSPHFPAGSWELEDPKVLRSQQATVLFKEFQELKDGSLQVKPCTFVYYGKDRGSEKTGRGPTIMQAPEGAILTFDEPLDFTRIENVKPVGGQLVGRIWISSTGGQKSDDLVMETSNVWISEQRIYTRDKVTFQLGDNYGVGRDLMLNLGGSDKHNKNLLGGLADIQLLHLEQLRVQVAGDDMFTALGSKPSKPAKASQPTTVLVHCDGPLNFDLREMIATVEDKVTITRQLPGKPADKLHANKLTMHLTNANQGESDLQQTKKKYKLALTRVVATGNPVTIDAPSESAFVQAKRLEYDFNTKKIKLRGFNPFAPKPKDPNQLGRVFLRNLEHEISVPAVDFSGSQDRSTWQIVAEGPGQYRGAFQKDGDRNVVASWSQRLSLQPFQGQQVLSVEGSAMVNSPETGAIRADVAEVWLKTARRAVATRMDGTTVYESKTTPTKLLTRSASGKSVTIDSPRLHGSLSGLTVLFESGLAKPNATRPTRSNERSSGDAAPTSKADAPEPRYRVEGGQLTIWVDAETQEFQRVSVRGASRLVEEPGVNERPLEIAGTAIDFHFDSLGNPIARLVGSPAILNTAEVQFSGHDIQLLGDENRVLVPGPGSLRMFVSGDLLSQSDSIVPLPTQPVDIQWQNSLHFDGLVVQLAGKVEATGKDLAVRTTDLTVTLGERIDLSQFGKSTSKPTVAKVIAAGGVFAASRSRDDEGELKSYYQMATRDLDMDLKSGETIANGPGWLAVTSLGSGLSSLAGAPKDTDPNQLTQQSVAFGHQLTGNLLRREAHLTNDIRAWFGPVQTWEERVDPLEVKDLGENDYSLTCREVFVMESPSAPAVNERTPLEILATGKTFVQGQRYAAVGHQIKYAEDKGMLTLEGDAQRPAKLWQRSSVDGPVSNTGRARRIRFWPKSGQLDVEGGLGLDISTSVSRKP